MLMMLEPLELELELPSDELEELDAQEMRSGRIVRPDFRAVLLGFRLTALAR